MRLSRILSGFFFAWAAVAVAANPGSPSVSAAETDVVDMVTVDPARLLDTRPAGSTIDDEFEGAGKVQGGQFTRVMIAGRGGVPDAATGVELNLTAIGAESGGFATLYPCTSPPPTASSLNFQQGVNIANATTVALNESGEVCVFTSAVAHFALDVVAFIPAGSNLVTVDPARLLDTRPAGSTIDDEFEGAGKVQGGQFTRVMIAGRGGVPDAATGVELNLTAIGAESGGFATLYPCTSPPPTASSLNFQQGVNIANATTVALNESGEVCVFTSAVAHFALDVVAFIPAGSNLVTVDPARLLDTRPAGSTIDDEFEGAGKVQGGQFTRVMIAGRGGVSDAATGVELNLTAIGAESGGFATLYPCTSPPPTASSLNFQQGVNIANATTVALNESGEVCVFTSAVAHFALDVVAFIAPTEDPGGNTVVLVGAGPLYVESDGTDLWVTNRVSRTVSRIDRVTNTVTATVEVASGAIQVAFDGTDIWITGGGGMVSRVDRNTNRVTATIDVGDDASAVASDGNHVWITNRFENTVSKIDPSTNTVTAIIDVGSSPHRIEFDGTDIWVSNLDGSTVSRIDPVTNNVTATIFVGAGTGPAGLTFDGTYLWVTNLFADAVSKIDVDTNTVVGSVDVGDIPRDVAFDGTNIWVTNFGGDSVSKIDPGTNDVSETITVGDSPSGITFDGTHLWIANSGSDFVSKISPS